MTSTMHKNQVHCPSVVQGWICSSLMSAASPVCRGKLQTCVLIVLLLDFIA